MLKKIVKVYCKNDRGKIIMEKVLGELLGDMFDCRYFWCGDKVIGNKDKL